MTIRDCKVKQAIPIMRIKMEHKYGNMSEIVIS